MSKLSKLKTPPSLRRCFRKLPGYFIHIVNHSKSILGNEVQIHLKWIFQSSHFDGIFFKQIVRANSAPSGNKFSFGITITPSPSIESLGWLGKGNDKVYFPWCIWICIYIISDHNILRMFKCIHRIWRRKHGSWVFLMLARNGRDFKMFMVKFNNFEMLFTNFFKHSSVFFMPFTTWASTSCHVLRKQNMRPQR